MIWLAFLLWLTGAHTFYRYMKAKMPWEFNDRRTGQRPALFLTFLIWPAIALTDMVVATVLWVRRLLG